MTAGSFDGHYVWHPAADDRDLARACVDVRVGRYWSAGQVLRETRENFALRGHRSLVLASEVADSDLAERWLAEEPDPEAALLWARVAMLRTLRAADKGDERTPALARMAFAAGERAAREAAWDPTPYVTQLALCRLPGVREYARDTAPEGLLTAPPGPWDLFFRIGDLDPRNREAHHRLLSFFFGRHGGRASAAWDVAAYLSQRAPASSELRLLPLVTLVDTYDPHAPGADRLWRQPQWESTMAGAYRHWFPARSGYRFTPVLDLAYLAHALFMARHEFEARAVLTAMGPYASRMPWSVFGKPEEELSRARRACGLPVPRAL